MKQVFAILALLVASVMPASADPISWSIAWPGNGVVDLQTSTGIAYSGTVRLGHTVDGYLPLWQLTTGPFLTLEADSYGFDLPSGAFGALQFSASTVRPQTDLDEATLSVPFAFAGALRYLVSSASITGGAGLMSVQLRRAGGDWQFVSASYPSTGDHAPEPATLLLLSTGLAGLCLRRKAVS